MAEFVGKEDVGKGIEENDENSKEKKEKEEEEERDDVGLTSASVTKHISSYLQSNPHDEDQQNSSDDEGVNQKEERKYSHDLESEEEEENHLAAYELVDDDYILQADHDEDEEFGEFKEASNELNGNHDDEVVEENNSSNGPHESQPSPDYKVPPFSVNRSSIPPLTAEKIDSIKRAMLSLNITPRPAAERIVSAVIAARPRLGDEACFQTENSLSSVDSELLPSSSVDPDTPPADFANFGDHFPNSVQEEPFQKES